MAPSALVTGITGQDGSYLAEFLLAQGYTVHGLARATSTGNLERIQHLDGRVTIHEADLLDEGGLFRILHDVRPTEVYNLAAQTFVPTSWAKPVFTSEVTALGTTRLLDAIRQVDENIRFYQAGSSEMFGRAHSAPQSETTPFWPRNPYSVAKVYSHWITVTYRESRGLFACSGILFNHESPRRGKEFVTRKITRTAAKIKLGLATELRLGNLQARRDWGFAGDYVRSMWMQLQQDEPSDYVIGTGELHSVGEFVETAFAHLNLDWRNYVAVDPEFYRPAETVPLLADPSQARDRLGWQPTVEFEQLVQMMVDADLASLSQPLDTSHTDWLRKAA